MEEERLGEVKVKLQARVLDSIYGSLSARRVTPALKISIQLYGNYNESSFDLGERTISSFSRSKGGSVLVVKSLGELSEAFACNRCGQ